MTWQLSKIGKFPVKYQKYRENFCKEYFTVALKFKVFKIAENNVILRH